MLYDHANLPTYSVIKPTKLYHICARVLELQKGSNTIECASSYDLVNTSTIIKSFVENGEIDSVIDAASVKVRERFGKWVVFFWALQF